MLPRFSLRGSEKCCNETEFEAILSYASPRLKSQSKSNISRTILNVRGGGGGVRGDGVSRRADRVFKIPLFGNMERTKILYLLAKILGKNSVSLETLNSSTQLKETIYSLKCHARS